MQTLLHLKSKANTLFIRLLISFFIVIALLLTYILFSLSFFQSYIRDMIIDYNSSNLINATHAMEQHFEASYRSELEFYFDEKAQSLNSPTIRYETVHQIYKDILVSVTNQTANIENLVLYFIDQPLVIEKNGTIVKESLFTKFYYNERLTPDFWNNQFNDDFNYRILPAAEFSERIFKSPASSKLLIPTIIKNRYSPRYVLLSFHDVNKVVQAAFRSNKPGVYILDADGQMIYADIDKEAAMVSSIAGQNGHRVYNHHYYFYRTGAFSNLTYVSVISIKQLSSSFARLNVTLISLLIISIVIAVATSIFLSVNFRNPIRQIVQAVRHMNPTLSVRSSIAEFRDLNANLNTMLKSIHDSTSLLKYHAYTGKLKQIHTPFLDMKDAISTDTPFLFILYQLFYKPDPIKKLGMDENKKTLYVQEYIHLNMLNVHHESLTFQIEKNQILSIVFHSDRNDVLDKLREMASTFGKDKEHLFISISVGSIHTGSQGFTAAYEQVLEMAKQRKFHDRTELIDGLSPQSDVNVTLTSLQVQKFDANMKSGNYQTVASLIKRILQQMVRNQATALQFGQFASYILKRASAIMSELNLSDAAPYDSPEAALQECCTPEQLEHFFDDYLSELCKAIRDGKKDNDYITQFVKDYISKHYAENVSLDMIADKLNVTAGYLSSYMKEKTGTNFIDYLNQVRIDEAKALLRNSSERIKTIAEKVGYQNMNSFHRMFKKYTGITPKEYRQSQHLHHNGD